MPNSRFYSSTAAPTSLQVTANPGDASIQVASSIGFPSSFPFTLSLDYGSANEELVDVTSGGPNVFNVTRSVDGTSATTHNAGAVVRHVSSARDFTDSRTHEASTTNVHGITGSFVDTLSTQTLSNKTLNSPVINNATETGTITATGTTRTGGTVTGATISSSTLNNDTVSGTVTMSSSPAVSGAWSNSGDITNTGQLIQKNLVAGSRGNTTDSLYEGRVSGDAKARWSSTASGDMLWGDGTNNPDVEFFRPSAGNLQISGSLAISSGLTVVNNVSATDITLSGGVWSTYAVTWTATGGGNSVGNGSLVGRYRKLGKEVTLQIMLTFGSTSNPGSGQYSFSLPFQAANLGIDTIGHAQYLGASRYAGQVVVSANATTTSPFFPNVFTSGPLAGAATSHLSQETESFPEPPGLGDKVRIAVVYEAA